MPIYNYTPPEPASFDANNPALTAFRKRQEAQRMLQEVIRQKLANQVMQQTMQYAGPQAAAELLKAQLLNQGTQAALPYAGYQAYGNAQKTLADAALAQAQARFMGYGGKGTLLTDENGQPVGNSAIGQYPQQNNAMPPSMPNPDEQVPAEQVPGQMSSVPFPEGNMQKFNANLQNPYVANAPQLINPDKERALANGVTNSEYANSPGLQQAIYSRLSPQAQSEAQEAASKVGNIKPLFDALKESYQGQQTAAGYTKFKGKQALSFLTGKTSPEVQQANIGNSILPQLYDTIRSIFTTSRNQGQAVAFANSLKPLIGESKQAYADRMDAERYYIENYARAQQKALVKGLPANDVAQKKRDEELFSPEALVKVAQKSAGAFKIIYQTLTPEQKARLKEYNKSLRGKE